MRSMIETFELPQSATNAANWLRGACADTLISAEKMNVPPDHVGVHLILTATQLAELVNKLGLVTIAGNEVHSVAPAVARSLRLVPSVQA
jgi:hypothetical protein